MLVGLGVANLNFLFPFVGVIDRTPVLVVDDCKSNFNFFFDFGVFGMVSMSFSSTESGAGWITVSTSFVRGFFRPDFLSLLFKLLFDKVRKLTCLVSGSTGKPTNILTAMM